MSQIDDGGPAFPRTVTIDDGIDSYREIKRDGMSLRDWFAGQALQGMVHRFDHPHKSRELMARDCYSIADAMLAARLTERK